MIFNGEMVRAILDSRKTQTRRVIKLFHERGMLNPVVRGRNGEISSVSCRLAPMLCPFGQPGDRIWVRETFSAVPDHDEPVGCSALLYAADGGTPYGKWKPSIHMPRWASRILLEITDVRVDRLNGISEADAQAEGIDMEALADSQDGYDCIADHNMTGRPTATGAFKYLWESIYGEENWLANPWVWVIEFKRIEGNSHATN